MCACVQEGIKAVREKASFLEAELRAQLEDARGFLADERRQRRAAEAAVAELEAGLNKRLEAAKTEIASLQAQVHSLLQHCYTLQGYPLDISLRHWCDMA